MGHGWVCSRGVWPVDVTCQIDFSCYIQSSTLHFEVGPLTESGLG